MLLVAPTGSGKTTMLAHLVHRFRGRVLILCPWVSLVGQSQERLAENGIEAGVVGRKVPDDRVVLATIGTACRRELGDDWGLIVVDEAHRSLAPKCSEILKAHPRSKLLGLTATPIRLDGKLLSSMFQRTVVSVTHAELVAQHYLVPHRVYGVSQEIDVSSLPIDRKTNDYELTALAKASMRPTLLADAVREYTRLGEWRPCFVYCVSVAHGQAVLEHYQRAGISADFVCGDTNKGDRLAMFGRMKTGALKVLINCAVLTEGIDYPELGCIQVLRATSSVGLHLQLLGRGCRVAKNKADCIVLDHAGNFRRHGFAEDDRDWEAEAKRQVGATSRSERHRPPRAKTCPQCGRVVPAVTRRCPHCGYQWTPLTAQGNLQRLMPGRLRIRARKPL